MNVNNDWERWAAVWQAQPPADLQRLRRGARHKLWRMGAFVAAELLASAIAVSQVVRLMMHPGLEWRWKVWAAMMLGFVLIMQYLFLRIRHGAWRSLGNDSTEFLRLEVRRAEAGIRLAKLNAWSLLLWVVVTLMVAAPELMPARWQHEPKLQLLILLQFAVNVPIIAGGLGLCAWYIRRQRRRLRDVQALLHGYAD